MSVADVTYVKTINPNFSGYRAEATTEALLPGMFFALIIKAIRDKSWHHINFDIDPDIFFNYNNLFLSVIENNLQSLKSLLTIEKVKEEKVEEVEKEEEAKKKVQIKLFNIYKDMSSLGSQIQIIIERNLDDLEELGELKKKIKEKASGN